MLRFFKSVTIKLLYFLIQFMEKIEYRDMTLNEDDVSKKIIDSINTLNLEVKTDTGYETVSKLHLTQPYTHWIVKTSNFKLQCADNHIVFDSNFKEIFVKELKVGDTIQTEKGEEKVISIQKFKYFKCKLLE